MAHLNQNSNSYIVLPDIFLKHQICNNCNLYLSCGPVKSYQDGAIVEVKCGRCTRDNDNGCYSQYNKLCARTMFPCVNRFNGCTTLIPFDKTILHEETCIGPEINCPLCPDDNQSKYPLLALINHFKSKHWKNFLHKPLITLSENLKTTYLYCDFDNSLFALMQVSIDNNSLCVKTMSPATNPLRQRIVIYNERVQIYGSEIFDSKLIDCLNLDDNSNGYKIPLNIIGQYQGLQCKFVLTPATHRVQYIPFLSDTPVLTNPIGERVTNGDGADASGSSIHVKEFAKEKTPNSKKRKIKKPSPKFVPQSTKLPSKKFPNIYLDLLFKKKFGQNHLLFYDVSTDKHSIVDRDSGQIVLVSCHYCENFLAVAGKVRNVYFCSSCSFSICGQCNSYGVDRVCPRCWDPQIKKSGEFARHYNLSFYCKYGCGHPFRAWDLLEHEAKCALNEHRNLTDEERAQTFFNVVMGEGDRFTQSNSVLFDKGQFSGKGRIFVVTRDDVRFIINYQYEPSNNACKFWITHSYEGVSVLVKICEGETFREVVDQFFISFNTEVAFIVVVFRDFYVEEAVLE